MDRDTKKKAGIGAAILGVLVGLFFWVKKAGAEPPPPPPPDRATLWGIVGF